MHSVWRAGDGARVADRGCQAFEWPVQWLCPQHGHSIEPVDGVQVLWERPEPFNVVGARMALRAYVERIASQDLGENEPPDMADTTTFDELRAQLRLLDRSA